MINQSGNGPGKRFEEFLVQLAKLFAKNYTRLVIILGVGFLAIITLLLLLFNS